MVGMTETAVEAAWQCGYCGTPIIVPDKIVEVEGVVYCCPNCELMARYPESAQRARRGGGMVLSCIQCHTPIFLPEIMINRGTRTFCNVNCAEVAERKLAATVAAAGGG